MQNLDARAWTSLILLAFVAFTYNTSESFPVGLLPQMASDLVVSEAAVGRLLTVYAVFVALTVLPLVTMLSGVSRRRLVLATVAMLVVSNLAMAIAPTYGWVLGSRLVSATTHGIFWSIVAPTAVMLVPRGKMGFATAVVFMGSSLAMVAGTPLTTALGAIWGWRTAMAALALVAGVAFIGLALVLPALEVDRPDSNTSRTPWWALVRSTLQNWALLGLCALTVVLVVAYFATYTYISLILDQFAGITGEALAVVLLGYGLAGILGVWVFGRFADRYPHGSGLACMALLALALLGIVLFASWSVVGLVASVVLVGGAFAATPVFLQSTVLRVAPETGDIASSLYVVAFQIGIAGGSLAGGFAVDSGWLNVIPWAAAGTTAAGLLLYWVTTRQRAPVTDRS